MKGIYLAACKARHANYDIVYQDIDDSYNCDLGGDMLDVDLSKYDYIIATPPCNWYSITNPYWYRSFYSLKTMHLLPCILMKAAMTGKPFIIENVRNSVRFNLVGIYRICDDLNIFVTTVGRHTYFTNVFCDLTVFQHQDFLCGGKRINNDGYNEGGSNVHEVIDTWLSCLYDGMPLSNSAVIDKYISSNIKYIYKQ